MGSRTLIAPLHHSGVPGRIAGVRLLRFLFKRLGRLYLAGAVAATLLAAHIILFATVALLALWVDLSGPEFGRIVAVSQGVLLLRSEERRVGKEGRTAQGAGQEETKKKRGK